MKIFKTLAVGAAAAVIATTAYAAVHFDPLTGTGFVGKGDVQTALGLNNHTLQTASLTFTYEVEENWQATCEWTTGPDRNRRTHDITVRKSSTIASSIALDPRVRNQITGFNLMGFASTVTQGTPVPNVGDPCIGEGANGTYVEPITPTPGGQGNLYVNGVLLPFI